MSDTDTSSKGRLFGRNVLEATFRAAPDEDLHLGELLVGVDEATDRRYLFRIVDVSYGSEHREPGWAERVAGNLLRDDSRGLKDAHQLHDPGVRTYRVATCACLGYLAPAPSGKRVEFKKPKSLPTQFSSVVSPQEQDFEFLIERMGDLRVGRLRSGEEILDLPVGIPGASLSSHIGIFATTGMGKSNLMQVLAGSAMASNGRYGLCLIDPHGEYLRALSAHPWAGESLRCYAARSLGGASALRISLGELNVDDLRTAYELSRPQEEALYELERHYSLPGLSWLVEFAKVNDLAGFRDTEISSRVALSTLQVLHRRARRITELRCIANDSSMSAGDRIVQDLKSAKVVLLDVSGMDSTEELLVASFITRRVLDEWQSAYLEDPEAHSKLPVVSIALEEAQRVLSKAKDSDSNVFPRLAREGRKFNVGLCAITQQPRLIDGELLSQLNTLFILGLADEKDRSVVRSSAKQDLSSQGQEIQTLMQGEALMVNLSAPFAVPTMIDLYSDTLLNISKPTTRTRPPVDRSAFI